MSQTSSGPPVIDLSPESLPLHEQGINQIDPPIADMETSASVSKDDLANNDFLTKNPASKRVSEPTLEHYLFFEELLKEAATLMDRIHKHSSAAQNVRSPTWERASLQIEECSKLIHAICTYTGVPASLLPSKKELIEMRKAKDLEILAEISTQPQPTEVIPVANIQVAATVEPKTTGPATKRKTLIFDDDEGFIVIQKKKDKRPTFTSRPVNESRAYSEVLRKANEGKQVNHAPQPIKAQEEPLPRANPNRPAPSVTERVVCNYECSLSEIFQCLMGLANSNPSHSHIILRAFGLAKDKMQSSQNKFDMSYHLFAAYTHVMSTSEFCTA
ncbi:hypothetical protein CDAR_89781 [Caerostris darwini]|uniref:Uncharacterized protein n=1 Tax=Caerostris darwini TaxID=1538125 RepID=A0AAV4UYQ7_9ARAC|nr:hypothetical protein CDAR_89781 [Caerostris darwini]